MRLAHFTSSQGILVADTAGSLRPCGSVHQRQWVTNASNRDESRPFHLQLCVVMSVGGSLVGRDQSAQGPIPVTRSMVKRRMKPGGGSSMGGNFTSGPR
jgi:hypothetical protein